MGVDTDLLETSNLSICFMVIFWNGGTCGTLTTAVAIFGYNHKKPFGKNTDLLETLHVFHRHSFGTVELVLSEESVQHIRNSW